MTKTPLISILICTRDRAEHLVATLDALQNHIFPSALSSEVIVVDNGSSDETSQIVTQAAAKGSNMEIRLLHEPRPGLSTARNAAIKEARGEYLVWLDDDVRPGPGWLEGMTAPLISGQADAVQGGIRLAPHLERDWMTATHRQFYACTRDFSGRPAALIGANMAYHRKVFEKVPAYDDELGAGKLGFGEDSLFAFQLIEAGFRLHGAWDVQVEHHFDVSRLSHKALEKRALQAGYSSAYVWHHWLNADMSRPALRLALNKARLALVQVKQGKRAGDEGCSLRELQVWDKIGFYQQYLVERSRPRKYAHRGLVKREI